MLEIAVLNIPVKMKQFVVLLAVLGLCLAAPSIEVENTNSTIVHQPTIGGRIVGGVVADISTLPWQVALLRNGAQICGGILIGPRVVLTAAHCVVASVIPQISQLSIRSGSSLHNSGGNVIAAASRVIHPSYSNLDYDIAVVNLVANANVGLASTIPLWAANTEFPAGTVGTVSGWGTTSESGLGSVQLRRVDVPIVAPVQCRLVYGSIITERTLCAGYTAGGQDACQGDSGGPYVIQNRLAGIVSFGSGCARPGIPGVYASVPGLRAWITQTTGI